MKLKNIPTEEMLTNHVEPAQYYCPANVYKVIEQDKKAHLIIDAQNCIHCKTCDIKDPNQNINWTPPEGGSGPNYLNI